MIPDKFKALIMLLIIAAVVVLVLLLSVGSSSETEVVGPAPKFVTEDIDGNEVSLADYEGKIVILHFIYLTEDTCPFCRAINEEQLKELKTAYGNSTDSRFEIITVDMTFSSDDGRVIDEREKQNISWPVINDPFIGSHNDRHFDETKVGGKYIKYLMQESALYFINPTLILLNKELEIVGVYHVGLLPQGISLDSEELDQDALDQVMTADELNEKIDKLENNEWGSTVEGKILAGVTLSGMFLFGLLVSITPCALMLLMIMTAYVASVGKKKKEEQEGHSEDEALKPGLQMMGESGNSGKAPESDIWLGASIGLAFTLGMGIVFFLEGVLFTFVGAIVRNAVIFDLIVGFFLVAISVHLVFGLDAIYKRFKKKNLSADMTETGGGVEKVSIFERGRLLGMKLVDKSVVLGALFLGMLLALGWAPCVLSLVSPVMLFLATQDVPVLMGGLYLFVFSLGYGVPVIVISTLTGTVKNKLANKFTSVGKWVPKVFGVLIFLFGILMALRFFGIKFW